MKTELRLEYEAEMLPLPYGKQINYESWLESKQFIHEREAFIAGWWAGYGVMKTDDGTGSAGESYADWKELKK